MKLSTLAEEKPSRQTVETFGGYNHNKKIGDNEFFDMKNMTSDEFPLLSTRKKRGSWVLPAGSTHSINGIIAKDALCYVDGTKFYINNYEVTGITLTDGPKQLVSMGAYVVIFPDEIWVNTIRPGGQTSYDWGTLGTTFSSTSTVTYSLCRVDGSTYGETTVGSDEPSNPNNMDVWIDTSTNPHVLKQYAKYTNSWTSIATTYIKISCPGIGAQFDEFDAVHISGIDPNLTQLSDLEGQVSPLWDVHHDPDYPANDYIVVVGIIDTTMTQTSTLTIKRRVPKMDFVCESNNRLWGCRYGTNFDNEVVNEIYASKLGDFKNWECFMGASTDSYMASCGTDGQWTGAITHLGYPVFFKENCLHKVYGNFPSNFQIQSTACRGVQKGCGDSLAIVGEILYYKSRNGVCAYDGSLPTEVSQAFGDIHYTGLDETDTDFLRNGAVAGSVGSKYYISMRSEVDNLWYLFVYDTKYGTWHKEDNFRSDAFYECDGELYAIDHSDKLIKSMTGRGEESEGDIDWMVESGIIGMTSSSGQYTNYHIGKKYVSQLNIRLSVALDAMARFSIQYDSIGEWQHITTVRATRLMSFMLPIRPKRCDHFRIRIEGRGDVKFFSVSKLLEEGSDY